jgi:ankyrin repeat protein
VDVSNFRLMSELLYEFDCQYGSTPLHDASMFHHAQVVELLLTANADPNAADKVR